ncbi:MAG: T9SS type A sorting domain-containing protein [Bacteroidales bacterium]|nr:T9SS type A sorting domain-containing protein [Bacteroidales bacterium]
MNIYNAAGKLVKSDEILKASNEYDLSNLPKGVYVVELRNGNNKSSSRIVLK